MHSMISVNEIKGLHMLVTPHSKQLSDFLLESFSNSAELNAFLSVEVWPRFRQRAVDQRNALKAQKKAANAYKPKSPINTRVTALDGSPLTKAQCVRRANAGEPVRRIADGVAVKYDLQNRRWVPVPENNT